MEEELLNEIGKYLVKQIKELIKTPKPRYTKVGNMLKAHSPYNFNASGKLYNSVSYVIRDNEIDILMEDYGKDFVFGEGSKPKSPPPIAPIEKWVRDKIHLQGAQARSMAFAVSKKLSQVGYKGYRIFSNDFQEETGKFVSQLLEQPEYQELALGDIFDRINLFGNQEYKLAFG